MSVPPPARRRVAVGLLSAAVLGLGLAVLAANAARVQSHRDAATRGAVISVQALVAVTRASGGAGEGVRQAVVGWASGHPDLRVIRVVQGVSLEASNAPEDTGDRAAPRRLQREEKALFDLGQRLRAAVETNRQEGAARKPEIEVAPTAAGGLSVAVPVETDGRVTGLIVVETAALPEAPAPPLLAALLALAAVLAVFGLGALLIGERTTPVTILAAVLLVSALGLAAGSSRRELTSARWLAESALAEQLVAEKGKVEALAATLGLPASPVDASLWDTDHFRRPRGLIGGTGVVNDAEVDAALVRGATRFNRGMVTAGVLALALLGFIAFGAAARVGAIVQRYRAAYAYVTPALLGMAVLVFAPFLYGIMLSFTEQTVYNTEKPITEVWAGFANFKEILGDFHVVRETEQGRAVNYQNFYWTLFFTVVWTISNVSIGVSVGLILALILNTKGLRFRALYRVLFILPWAMPNYITALIWKGMFHQQFGVVNQVVQMVGGQPVSWFEHTWTSFAAVLTTNAWLSVPFMMVISLGALQSIPADLYEAARVDGATRGQQFRSITLPSLKPALVPAVILSVIWTFNQFNVIYLVSAGEPGHSTEILITQAFKFAFEQYRYGYAAAYSTVIFAILLLYGTWQNRVTRATEGV